MTMLGSKLMIPQLVSRVRFPGRSNLMVELKSGVHALSARGRVRK